MGTRWCSRCYGPAIPLAAENGANPTEFASVEQGLCTTNDLTKESTLRCAEAQNHRGKLGGVCVNFPRAGYSCPLKNVARTPRPSESQLENHGRGVRAVGFSLAAVPDQEFATSRAGLRQAGSEVALANGDIDEAYQHAKQTPHCIRIRRADRRTGPALEATPFHLSPPFESRHKCRRIAARDEPPHTSRSDSRSSTRPHPPLRRAAV